MEVKPEDLGNDTGTQNENVEGATGTGSVDAISKGSVDETVNDLVTEIDESQSIIEPVKNEVDETKTFPPKVELWSHLIVIGKSILYIFFIFLF